MDVDRLKKLKKDIVEQASQSGPVEPDPDDLQEVEFL